MSRIGFYSLGHACYRVSECGLPVDDVAWVISCSQKNDSLQLWRFYNPFYPKLSIDNFTIIMSRAHFPFAEGHTRDVGFFAGGDGHSSSPLTTEEAGWFVPWLDNYKRVKNLVDPR